MRTWNIDLPEGFQQKMSNNKPRVSIGLPVFNGERYLEEALDSILVQTYPDFELIISDNASTDRTQRICRAYAAENKCIRYYRNERNLGAAKNFNLVFELSRGEYFKWAAYDDILAPEFLSKCVKILDWDPSVVLCHCKTSRIDEHGALVGNYGHTMRIDSRKPHERFGDLISLTNPCWMIFGVIRAGSLKMTSLIGDYIASDRNFLAEIGLLGRMYEIPEYLFCRRDHQEAYTHTYYIREDGTLNYQKQLTWWTEANRISFPYWRNCLEYFKSVTRVPLKWSEKRLCYEQIGRWILREGWTWMASDVENVLLRRSSLGRKLASALKLVARHTMIPFMKRRR
jgi:glycosyltransferase involved in cell wall biosynthesis